MLTAVRLSDNSNAHSHEGIGVNATLVLPYTFYKLDGKEVSLDIGTPIHVDEERGIASFQDDYFAVEPADYKIDFAN